jgi:hypothetical protein
MPVIPPVGLLTLTPVALLLFVTLIVGGVTVVGIPVIPPVGLLTLNPVALLLLVI